MKNKVLGVLALCLSFTLSAHAQGISIISGSFSDGSIRRIQTDTSGNLIISGNITNGVAQGSTTSGQVGSLTQCAATTSSPSYTNGQTNPLTCDTTGNLRVAIPSDTVNTTPPTYANAAPIQHLEYAQNGQVIFMPYQNPSYYVNGTTAAITDTTSTSVIPSAGGSLRNYITECTISNSHATVGTFVKILDGSTIMYEVYAGPLGGGAAPPFPTPLRGSAATAVNAQPVTTGANVIVSCSGFKGL